MFIIKFMPSSSLFGGPPLWIISTFNTDYVLTKKTDFDKALKVLARVVHEILNH